MRFPFSHCLGGLIWGGGTWWNQAPCSCSAALLPGHKSLDAIDSHDLVMYSDLTIVAGFLIPYIQTVTQTHLQTHLKNDGTMERKNFCWQDARQKKQVRVSMWRPVHLGWPSQLSGRMPMAWVLLGILRPLSGCQKYQNIHDSRWTAEPSLWQPIESQALVPKTCKKDPTNWILSAFRFWSWYSQGFPGTEYRGLNTGQQQA